MDIRDIWAFHLHQAGTHSLQKKCFRQRREAVTMMLAAFAFLARRATGLPVRICVGTGKVFNSSVWQNHGWVEIKISGKWYTFDTNANRFSSLRKGKWFMQKRTSMEGKVYKTQKTYYVNF